MVDIATLAIAVDSSDLQDGTRQLDRMGDQATQTGAQVVRATRNMAGGFDGMGRHANASSRAFQGLATPLRQTSVQLSQVAQQTMVTGNFMQALAIQLPDIGLAFGTIGIGAGIAASVLVPLASELLDVGDATKTAEEAAADLLDTYRRIEALDFSSVAASARVALEEFAPLIEFLREEAMSGLQQQVSDVLNSSGFFDALDETVAQYEALEATIVHLQAEAAASFDPEVQRLYAAAIEDVRAEMVQVETVLQGQQTAAGQILSIVGETREEYLRQAQAALETLDAADMLDDATRSALAGIIDAIDPTGTLRDILGEAEENASGIASSLSRVTDMVSEFAAARRARMSGFDGNGEVILDPRDPRYDPVAAAFDEFSRVPTTRPQADRTPRVTGGGSAPAIREITAAHQMAASAIAEAERAAVTYADVQAELNAMLAAGDIDATSYAAALEIAREHLESATDATSLWAGEQRRLQDGILDAIEGGENLSDVFRDVARSIARAAAEAALFNSGPLAGMFSGGSMNFGGFFGGLFGGFRANGGPVSSGQAYVVGERGPELFVPNQGGQIVPNRVAQSGGNTTNVTVNYSFQGGITEADLGRALPVLVERTKREVVDAVQRGGAVARVLR